MGKSIINEKFSIATFDQPRIIHMEGVFFSRFGILFWIAVSVSLLLCLVVFFSCFPVLQIRDSNFNVLQALCKQRRKKLQKETHAKRDKNQHNADNGMYALVMFYVVLQGGAAPSSPMPPCQCPSYSLRLSPDQEIVFHFGNFHLHVFPTHHSSM